MANGRVGCSHFLSGSDGDCRSRDRSPDPGVRVEVWVVAGAWGRNSTFMELCGVEWILLHSSLAFVAGNKHLTHIA